MYIANLDCKALSEKCNNRFEELSFHGGIEQQRSIVRLLRVGCEPVNPGIENSLNTSLD